MEYNITNINEFIKLVNIGDIEYPYQRIWTTDDEIRNMFNKLKRYRYEDRIINRYYRIKAIKIESKYLIYKGKPKLIINKDSD